MRLRRGLQQVILVLLCAQQWSVGGPANAFDHETQRRFLVIYSDTSTLSANVGIAQGLRAVLGDALSPRAEVFTEFRGIQQFPGPEYDLSFVDMLERKYAHETVDIVMAIGPAATRIVSDHQSRFAPGTPVVAGALTERSVPDPLPDNWHAAVGSFDLGETIALARRMQPEASRMVIFTGSSDFDARWQVAAREELDDEDGITVEYVTGLTLAGFKSAAAALDPDTILLILTIFEDAEGARFIPAEAAASIAATSAAPSWGVYSTFVGDGVVGGVFETFEAIGRTVGELALAVLDRTTVPPSVVSVPSVTVIDWAQLRRFGLDARLLPADAMLLHYAPSVWERYRTAIVLILGVVFAQTATIAALVIQGRRRRAAEVEVAERRLELARLSRVSQLGELSGAITHELNQPLTSILANAEAGAMLLRKSPPDLGEVADILHDIAEDDRRASDIIAGLRKLMRRDPVEPAPLDLNAVVSAVERLTASELLVRGVRLVVQRAPHPLMVMGNMEHYQQVLLNLMLNGFDAMTDQPRESRLLTITTSERPDGWRELSVHDTGPGVPEAVRDDPFRPFRTTKDSGMGMGLAICRTIAEAYGGVLAFEEVENGTRVVFALPPT